MLLKKGSNIVNQTPHFALSSLPADAKLQFSLKRYQLEVVVFIAGAAVMVFELVGSRIVAPYLGSSIFVWTSIIGVVLGSLSIGYFWGGKIADEKPSYAKLSLIIFSSAIAVGFIGILKDLILIFVSSNILDLRISSFLASILLFAPASILFGMVSPYAVKLKMKDLKKTGRTVGNLYAISTVGSIVGTFAAGFFLISFFGSTRILFILAIVLAITSLLAGFSEFFKTKIIAIVFFSTVFIVSMQISNTNKAKGFLDVDTNYSRVRVYEGVDRASGRKVRALTFDPKTTQSAMFLDSDDLVFEYAKYFLLAWNFNPQIDNALVLGGAGYSLPKYYLKKFNDAKIDVVEIDPQITEIARKYFKLVDNERLSIYHEDARTFLNREGKNSKGKYDVVFGDAYNSAHSIPFQLTTKEAMRLTYDLLDDDGMFFVNAISAIEGDKNPFLRSLVSTLGGVFSEVLVYPTRGDKPFEIQNVVVVGFKVKPEVKTADVWERKIEEGVVLSDDFAPVDRLMSKAIVIN